jgi:CBS domain-containing protein
MKRYTECFAKPVLTVGPNDPLAAAAQAMKKHNVGAVVVVESRRPVGVLTDRDLALALAVNGATPHAPVVRVR